MDFVTTDSFILPLELRSAQSTLRHMALVACEQNVRSYRLLQETIHHLAHKVKVRGLAEDERHLAAEECDFLKVIFCCPWWGGQEFGLNEAHRILNLNASDTPISDNTQLALARMAQHYIQGQGHCYPLNLSIYRNASIVRDTVHAMRDYIRELYTFKKPATLVSTTDASFLQSKYALAVEAQRKHSEVKGFIFKDGTLMLDQRDPRLIALGNRFRIVAMTSPLGNQLMTRWRVAGTYRFENFKQGDAEVGLPLCDQLVLTIPSYLGVYLADVGIAKPFDYFADWVEKYRLTDF